MVNDVFEHGVASGDPTSNGVVLWTRVTGGRGDVPVSWTVAVDPAMRHVVAGGEAMARADRDRCVAVDVGGLEPATTYWYAFGADCAASIVGRTRTLPGGGASGLRFAYTSRPTAVSGFFNAYDRLADRDDVDLVVHLGGDGGDVDARRDPSVQRLGAAHPVIHAPAGRHRSVAIGDLADLVLGGEGTWLSDALRASTARWRLLGRPSVLSVPSAAPGRTPLLDVLDELDDVVVLSGDTRGGFAAELHRDPTASTEHPVAVELVAPPVTSHDVESPADGHAIAHPHVDWADGHGYVLVDLDREQLRASWWFVDEVLRPSYFERCVARVTVKRGSRTLVEE